jgi:presqualene diphosphate synthase
MREYRVTTSDATLNAGPADGDSANTGSANAVRASGSSFYMAMRILPQAQRDAMFAIYSFCRQVDDVADDPGPREARRTELAAWRADIEALYRGAVTARTRDLLKPMRDYGLEKADFLAVIDGMETDVIADVRAPAWSELDLYCDRVASAVGRLSVKVFGLGRAAGIGLSHHLGRALQLTNILRDLDEDAAVGRLYLPQEALAAAGIGGAADPSAVLADPSLGRACAQLVDAARSHFAEADAIMAAEPRRVVRAPRIMGAVYRLILEQTAARGFLPPRRPVKLAKPRIVWIILRYAII